MEHLLGFDIGGTKCAVILGGLQEDRPGIIARSAFETSRGGPQPTLERLEGEARQLLAAHSLGVAEIKGLGISCGGPLSSARGVISSPPNLPGWDGVEICRHYRQRLNIPVSLQNDANAGALAEWRWGAGRGCRHMVFLTCGTGMGAGLILNGRLYAGAEDLAGEVGHVRLAEDGPLGYGKRGSFEGFCSGGGIANLAREVVAQVWQRGRTVSFCPDPEALPQLSARTVADAARAGDPIAGEIMNCAGRKLGEGLALLIDILNPERIVIGGIFMRQHDLLWPAAEAAIAREALPQAARACRVLPSELGEQIGDYAALSVAMP